MCGERGLLRGGAENRTETVVQEHKTIKCRHTHSKQNTHNATNWLAKMRVAIDGVCDLCEEEMGIQHILYTRMKFTKANMRLPR
jgi:truncated hemoglobin YjbI